MDNEKFIVKEVSEVEQKSRAQVEEELLQKHEEQFQDSESSESVDQVDTASDQEAPQPETQEGTGLKDEDVLEYIKSRYDKEINSVDELFAQTAANEELPEDVSAFFKYKKETGRSFDDYVKLQKNYDDMEGDAVIANYYAQTEEGLDEIDIQDMIQDRFGYEEDYDDEKDVRKKKLAHKRELAKAKKFFKEQQEQYKIPLESSGGFSSEEQTEEFNRYKSYVEESTTREEQMKKRYNWFVEKSNEVLNDDFKGFNFTVNDKQYTYKPGDGKELFNKQNDVNNFVKPYLDSESGMMKDAE